jgi:hypothetical protein
MAYHLNVNLEELSVNFVNSLMEHFPASFSDIAAIKAIEDHGFELYHVDTTSSTYHPGEFREYIKEQVLDTNIKRLRGTGTYVHGPDTFIFLDENGKNTYSVIGTVMMRDDSVEIILSPEGLKRSGMKLK